MDKQRIAEWLQAHKDEMLNDIFELVSIDSTRGVKTAEYPFGEGPAKAISKACDIAESYGFAVQNMENYVCTVDMFKGNTELDILAHLDVVPADEKEWQVTRPFEPALVGDKLYGRGVADDKGPAIAALYAMRAVKELGYELNKNVRLILGGDEECDSADIEYYYSKKKPATYTVSPDADFPIINVERGRYAAEYSARYEASEERILYIECGTKDNVIPGKLEMCIKGLSDEELVIISERSSELGIVLSTEAHEECNIIRLKGISGHAAEPEKAKNVLTAGLEIIKVITEHESPLNNALFGLSVIFPYGDHYGVAAGVSMEDEVSGRLTMSLNRLHYHEGTLKAVFDSRVPEIATEETVVAVMEANGEKYGLKINDAKMSRPHIVRADSPLVQTLLNCYEEVTEQKGYTIAIGGGTYVHEIENGVAFGPTEQDIATNIHGNDENIPVASLVKTAIIYALAIIEICK